MFDRVKQVLLVDDEEGFLECLVDALSVFKNHFNIQTASNGKEAVEILKLPPIDLVITDLSMPEMDGFELLAYMNRNYLKIPVIFMTAYSTPKIEEIVNKMGVLRYMEKPLDHSLGRLIPGRHYRPAAADIFIGELAATIVKGLGIKPTEAELTQARAKVSDGQIIRGTKIPSVIDYRDLFAFKATKEDAEQGKVDAQFYVGYSYFAGELVAKKDREAIKWFRKAAYQGHVLAKLYLGHMYLRGDGVDKDNREGVKLIIKAAEQGNPYAQFYLAKMYLDGDGVAQDKSEALKWFKKAAEQGNEAAKSNIQTLQQL
jgi:CheY-like chemotaxis protein